MSEATMPENFSPPEKTFTPPPVTGYRTLTQSEVDQMNECKALGIELDRLCERVKALPGVDQRCAAIGKTELQTGLMWLIRAIAKPTTF